MTVPVMARAASNNLMLTDAEPQYASRLCWAAAEVLAVNQFYPNCPPTTSTPPATPAFFSTSQGLEAGYHGWNYSTSSPPLSTLSWFLSTCEGNIQRKPDCNDWDSPQLYGLTFKWGKDFNDSNGSPDPDGLNWEAITQEIDNGRPVLFKWGYLLDGTGTSPVAKHQLVVIGYSDDDGSQQLQIWDPLPWPDPLPSQVPACGPASDVVVTSDHNRWIPFSTYRNPLNDMGGQVTALHDLDQWDLEMAAPIARARGAPVLVRYDEAPPPATPAPVHKLPHPPPQAPVQVSFAKALSVALPESRRLDLQVPGAAPRSLGVPFPIVALGFQQLLGAADHPSSLLTGTTSAILFPVESQGEVVDAFLMLFMEGRWQRGGYANLGITRRLVNVRARYAKGQQVSLDSFYMVSVPGEVAFFAAYGKGKQAILIPASTDPSIDAVAGKGVPAEPQLRTLIHVIQRDLQRYQAHSRAAVRSRG
jgi:hypothetical protein